MFVNAISSKALKKINVYNWLCVNAFTDDVDSDDYEDAMIVPDKTTNGKVFIS